MFSGDFTLAKDEDFGDYYCDLSEKSNRILRATVKTYEQKGTCVFLRLFKKKPDAELVLAQKITLTEEEFQILLWKGKSVQQPSNFKVTKMCKKIRNPHLLILWRRRMTQKTRRILILESMVEAMFERSPDYFKQVRIHYRFFIQGKTQSWRGIPNRCCYFYLLTVWAL